jgi:GntR family transcriptional regulator/MocR family aminotransferase
MRTTSLPRSPELYLQLDRSRPRGLRAQVEAELRDAIRSGRLPAGTEIPSSRALAADLGVTRGVVVAAYDQLIAEGYLLARPGSGTVINALPTEPATPRPTTPTPGPLLDFAPAVPDLAQFPRTAWLQATRTALATMPDADLGYVDPFGLPALRQELAGYLGRVRGVSADPERIVVSGGFGGGYNLAIAALRAMDRRLRVAVEDPGYVGARLLLDLAGVPWVPVPIDGDGIVVDALTETPAGAVVVTPAHQSPTGAVLSSARRSALLDWARRTDGYVIEDDYDAEYRYDRQPVGAVQGLAPDRVVYVGTASKSIAPGLRLGWVVLPEALVEPARRIRLVDDDFPATILQATYAAFLAAGARDRLLRRTRRIYRQRRDGLIAALQQHLPAARTSGASAGLHVLTTLPVPVGREDAIVAAAADRGIRVHSGTRYRATAPAPGANAQLVLGYGRVTPEQADDGVRRLAEAIDAATGS